MPKQAKELSAVEVRRLRKPGLHAVGGVNGLYLRIKPSGARSWALRIVVGDRRREIGCGGFPTVTLGQARNTAREYREEVRQGIDPVAAKRERHDAQRKKDASRLTFKDAVHSFLKQKTLEFRNSKHAAQWRSTLETYAIPKIGALPVDQVEIAHVVSCLEPIWTTKTETASRLRGRIEAVLAWATVSGYRSGDNPARWRGNLEHALPKPSKIAKVTHHPALPWQEVPEFVARLRKREGMAARALEFAILTAARSGEVREACWREIDLDAKLWSVPADRMKSGRPHKVPLSDAAIALLKSVPRFEGSDIIFAAPRGGPLSDMALSQLCRRMKIKAVPHGMRSSFKDWARNSTAYADEVSELALAHVSTDATRAAYARDELLPKRRKLMRDWAKYLDTERQPADVVPIRGARK